MRFVGIQYLPLTVATDPDIRINYGPGATDLPGLERFDGDERRHYPTGGPKAEL